MFTVQSWLNIAAVAIAVIYVASGIFRLMLVFFM
jgi:hypothetical protein